MSEREIIFQELCEKNVQGIRSSGAKKVVTISPPTVSTHLKPGRVSRSLLSLETQRGLGSSQESVAEHLGNRTGGNGPQ